MKKVRLEQVQPYEAAGHFKMVALRLHGKEETGSEKFWIGISHFLPGLPSDQSRRHHSNRKYHHKLNCSRLKNYK